MINIDSRAFEKLISDFIDAKDIRTLVDRFSKDRAFYYHVLKDISMGRESQNYKILKKVARKKKVSESFIIEQAKSVLSYIAPYDEPELENYYEVLNVSPDATDEIIREKWLELMKANHPDKVGQDGLDRAKRINEAYQVLGTPSKRFDYDTKHPPSIQIKVNDADANGTSRILLYLVPFLLVIGASYLYLSSSGLVSQSESEKQILANNIQNPTLPEMDIDQQSLSSNLDGYELQGIEKEDIESDISEMSAKNENKSQENSSNILDEENNEMPDTLEDENNPKFVKIIPDDTESNSDLEVEKLQINERELNSSNEISSNYDRNIATPAVAINEQEFRHNELLPTTPLPDSDSLYEFVSQYVSAYKNRDLQTIRSLFAPNARENGVSIYKVLDTYKSNFTTLDIIRYDVKVKRSNIDNYAGIVMGDFIVTFLNPKNNLTKNSRGSITWLLKWRGHKWEIEEINYKIYDTNVIDG